MQEREHMPSKEALEVKEVVPLPKALPSLLYVNLSWPISRKPGTAVRNMDIIFPPAFHKSLASDHGSLQSSSLFLCKIHNADRSDQLRVLASLASKISIWFEK